MPVVFLAGMSQNFVQSTCTRPRGALLLLSIFSHWVVKRKKTKICSLRFLVWREKNPQNIFVNSYISQLNNYLTYIIPQRKIVFYLEEVSRTGLFRSIDRNKRVIYIQFQPDNIYYTYSRLKIYYPSCFSR